MSVAVSDARHGADDIEREIAQWVVALSLDAIPEQVLAVARDCVADGIGVMIAGAHSEVFDAIARLPMHPGRCAVVGSSAGADVLSAALHNGAACHAWDFDDTSYAGIVHGTAVVLPAVLAVAQETGASGARFLAAFVAGVETVYALGLGLTDSLYARGHWSTTTLGVIGAAAGAASLLALPVDATASAIGLAANMPLGLRAIHGSTGKPYLCGLAARLGVEAAYAARAGIRAPAGAFGRRRGFVDTLNGGVFRRAAIDALGTRHALVDPGVARKLRPLCSATQAAIDATACLKAEHGLQPDDIASVQCYGTALVVSCLTYTTPVTVSQAQFSMQFAIACTLLHGDVTLAHLEDALFSTPAMGALMQRIDLQEDPELVPAAELVACPEAARVEIRLHDGRTLTRTVLAAAGMPQHPAEADRLRQKFLDCTARAMPADEAASLWATLQQAQHLPHLHGVPRPVSERRG